MSIANVAVYVGSNSGNPIKYEWKALISSLRTSQVASCSVDSTCPGRDKKHTRKYKYLDTRRLIGVLICICRQKEMKNQPADSDDEWILWFLDICFSPGILGGLFTQSASQLAYLPWQEAWLPRWIDTRNCFESKHWIYSNSSSNSEGERRGIDRYVAIFSFSPALAAAYCGRSRMELFVLFTVRSTDSWGIFCSHNYLVS